MSKELKPDSGCTVEVFVRQLAPLIAKWSAVEDESLYPSEETFRKVREEERHQCAADLVNAVGIALMHHHGFIVPNAGVSSSGDEPEYAPRVCSHVNQCDGCRRGLPVDDIQIHREDDGRPYMMCDSSLYANAQDHRRQKPQEGNA